MWIVLNLGSEWKFLDKYYICICSYLFLFLAVDCNFLDRKLSFLWFTIYAVLLVQTVQDICLEACYNSFFTPFVDQHVEHIDTEFTLKETLSEKEQKFGECLSARLSVYLCTCIDTLSC